MCDQQEGRSDAVQKNSFNRASFNNDAVKDEEINPIHSKAKETLLLFLDADILNLVFQLQ